jgi:hypothetical protein
LPSTESLSHEKYEELSLFEEVVDFGPGFSSMFQHMNNLKINLNITKVLEHLI